MSAVTVNDETLARWAHRLHTKPGHLCGCGFVMDENHEPSGECFVEGWPTCVAYPSLRLCFGWAPGDPVPHLFPQVIDSPAPEGGEGRG